MIPRGKLVIETLNGEPANVLVEVDGEPVALLGNVSAVFGQYTVGQPALTTLDVLQATWREAKR